MNEFLLIFRRDFTTKEEQPSPEVLQTSLKAWQDWFGSLAAQNKLARPLQRWDGEGRIVKPNSAVINGPYAEIKESIGGMIVVTAADYDEASEIAKGCPILKLGGNVEIRMAVTPPANK
ncbi:YciI family protein [Dyadobacter sp. CY312]|uniref:YciI family protein n=1 Tax=Dyadobacter sp. CY312 TaxID=2907303 RepID=UPI001F46D746|nr:YciI family protein [Dyadobacter sp. CY312]MCE7040309.1 YciI family protein [Dyadobacter sp. CY312]